MSHLQVHHTESVAHTDTKMTQNNQFMNLVEKEKCTAAATIVNTFVVNNHTRILNECYGKNSRAMLDGLNSIVVDALSSLMVSNLVQKDISVASSSKHHLTNILVTMYKEEQKKIITIKFEGTQKVSVETKFVGPTVEQVKAELCKIDLATQIKFLYTFNSDFGDAVLDSISKDPECCKLFSDFDIRCVCNIQSLFSIVSKAS